MYKNVCAKLHLQLVYMNTIMSSFVLTILSNAIYDLIEIKVCEMINVSRNSEVVGDVIAALVSEYCSHTYN